jgi:hypothetical protein
MATVGQLSAVPHHVIHHYSVSAFAVPSMIDDVSLHNSNSNYG